ncbi:SAM-dependent methyltransferase [Saccharopolyspora sp. TS4A08]|uniref:SAM-dependent methyltransferase n=1 Tax=Saccharopolyspora ipomoeae TaxID=3042027 RepID=A0ABT6PJI6_9PSEU|nr:SAM-dependent methyltransferase [Saccharopolyspora sp. TS4A08]MDI2028160.1 SAM-dependent methyltransferase [Saccharopolyspora sp. TS4A08]
MSLDTTQPSAARAYDYFPGGHSNFAADREFAEQVKAIAPSVPNMTRLNRNFLRRVVQHCLDQGVRQFLDLGSGIPTAGNTRTRSPRAPTRARPTPTPASRSTRAITPRSCPGSRA